MRFLKTLFCFQQQYNTAKTPLQKGKSWLKAPETFLRWILMGNEHLQKTPGQDKDTLHTTWCFLNEYLLHSGCKKLIVPDCLLQGGIYTTLEVWAVASSAMPVTTYIDTVTLSDEGPPNTFWNMELKGNFILEQKFLFLAYVFYELPEYSLCFVSKLPRPVSRPLKRPDLHSHKTTVLS